MTTEQLEQEFNKLIKQQYKSSGGKYVYYANQWLTKQEYIEIRQNELRVH